MTNRLPLWLMDVDGPLNVNYVRLPGPELRSFKAGNGFHIMYRPDITERIAKLHANGKVELQWLTTWEELADVHLAEEFGLPRALKVAGTYAGDDDGGWFWWKLNVVARLYAEGHRIVWTDDEIGDEYRQVNEWLKQHGVPPDMVLTMSPDERIGITHEFIDRVEAWL